jgi:hypothetical protein
VTWTLQFRELAIPPHLKLLRCLLKIRSRPEPFFNFGLLAKRLSAMLVILLAVGSYPTRGVSELREFMDG